MPEYLAPGVYVEEIEGPKSIQGVSTSTAGFLGITERGPLKPRLVTSMTQFLNIYGTFLPDNYLAYSVDGFFKNGGRRCYIARIVRQTAKPSESEIIPISSDNPPKTLKIKALGHGEWGNHVYYKIQNASNGNSKNLNLTILYVKDEQDVLPDILKKDVDGNDIIFTPDPTHPFNRFLKKKKTPAIVDKYIDLTFDLESQNYFKKLINGISDLITVNEDQLDKQPDKIPSTKIKIFSTDSIDSDSHHQKYLANFLVWNFGLNWLNPDDPPESDTDPEIVTFRKGSDTLVVDWKAQNGKANVILNGRKIYEFSVEDGKNVYSSNIVALTGGQDYNESDPNDNPTLKLSDYEGTEIEGDEPNVKEYTGLKGFEKIDDISLIFCPEQPQVPGLTDLLIDHCETLKFRFAILQADRNSHDIESINIERETKYAALYYPWIGIVNEKNIPILIPPGGHVAGIYARTDIEIGAFKSPAGVGAKIRGVRSLQKQLTFPEIEVLNYKQVNSLTYKPFIGPVVWGARTMSTDVNWRYIAIRRILSLIEKSIVNACESFVFEPNTPRLWSRVLATITPFLSNLRRDGALGGRTDEEAFFVKCDETTMTPEDIKQGKLIIRVGVRLAGVAEFVIIRISQTTGSIGEIEEI